jgi:hypothetical protein
MTTQGAHTRAGERGRGQGLSLGADTRHRREEPGSGRGGRVPRLADDPRRWSGSRGPGDRRRIPCLPRVRKRRRCAATVAPRGRARARDETIGVPFPLRGQLGAQPDGRGDRTQPRARWGAGGLRGIRALDREARGRAGARGDRDRHLRATLCADEVCPVFLGKAVRLHWGLPDPAAVVEPDERFESFRAARDELRRRLGVLFDVG